MGGVFNHINSNLYAYAANNPVRYIDPDGKTDRDILIDAIMTDSKISQDAYWLDNTHQELGYYRTYTLGENAKKILKSISTKACTHGAISFRNEYSKSKLPLIEIASVLKESKYLNYYKDLNGNIETNPYELYKNMKIGDLLIYIPDYAYLSEYGIKPEDITFTGHTATIIGKGSDKYGDFFDILEFHTQDSEKEWNPPSIKRVYLETLRSFPDCELYGGASWK